MSLDALPTQLLTGIAIRLSRHAALISFALCCKKLHRICVPYLSRFTLLKRRWGSINEGPDLPTLSSVEVLHAIVTDPDIAWAVERLNVRACPDMQYEWKEWQLDRSRIDVDALRAVISRSSPLLHASSGDLQEDCDADSWIARLRLEGAVSEDVRTADMADFSRGPQGWQTSRALVLISMLPNLKALTLPQEWSAYKLCEDDWGHSLEDVVFSALVDRACSEAAGDEGALRNLERLEPWISPGRDAGVLLKKTVPFMVLPSIHDVHLCSAIADSRNLGYPFQWAYPGTKSMIRTLHLENCSISAQTIDDLLAHTPHVRSFAYSHESKHSALGMDWDAGAFAQAIAKNIGATIADLSLLVNALDGDIETGITSLTDCKALKDVTLDIRVFCAPAPTSGLRLGLEGNGDGSWGVEDVATHIDTLFPVGIRRVHLRSKGSSDDLDLKVLKKVFSGSQDLLASETYPFLERLSVHFSPDDLMFVRESLSGVAELAEGEHFDDEHDGYTREELDPYFGVVRLLQGVGATLMFSPASS